MLSYVNSALSQEIDTLMVCQNDTTYFESSLVRTMPCVKNSPRIRSVYTLKAPKENTYYFIYSSNHLLVKEGLCTSRFIEGEKLNELYDSKYYYYHKKGVLSTIFYMEDGRTVKAEFYNKRGKLKETKSYMN